MDSNVHHAGEQWEFICERNGGWSWRRRAGDGRVAARSMHTLATLDAALEDAAASGFTYRSPARSA